MGKIIFNGKSRATPYGWHGKTVSKFILGGKVCTLGAATPPPPLHPAIEPPGAITFPNGFAYLGKWPTAADTQAELTYLSTTADTTLTVTPLVTNTALRYMAIPWVKVLPDNAFTSLSSGVIYAPELVTVGNNVLSVSVTTQLEAPKLRTAGTNFLLRYFGTSISLPALQTLGRGSFQHATRLTSIDLPLLTNLPQGCFLDAPLTHISMPKLDTFTHSTSGIFKNIVNAATTTVTLPSKFNTPAEKDRLFGAGNWYQITFTWV